MANKMNSTKVVTGVVRLSYANVDHSGVLRTGRESVGQ